MSIHKNTEFLIVCLYTLATTLQSAVIGIIGMDFTSMRRCLLGFFPREFSQSTIAAAVHGFSMSVTGIACNKLVINLMWT
jgi:hypothetical protein